MKEVPTLVLGVLLCVLNTNCHPSPLVKTNNDPPAEIGVDGIGDTRVANDNRADTYGIYDVTAKRFKRAGSFTTGSRGRCKQECAAKDAICACSLVCCCCVPLGLPWPHSHDTLNCLPQFPTLLG